jgi:hypothetical protein
MIRVIRVPLMRSLLRTAIVAVYIIDHCSKVEAEPAKAATSGKRPTDKKKTGFADLFRIYFT